MTNHPGSPLPLSLLQTRQWLAELIYFPQSKNPKGEVHEDWGMISYDRARKRWVLRQLHVESFVNQYVAEPHSAESKTFRFVSESVENIPPGFRARETYL